MGVLTNTEKSQRLACAATAALTSCCTAPRTPQPGQPQIKRIFPLNLCSRQQPPENANFFNLRPGGNRAVRPSRHNKLHAIAGDCAEITGFRSAGSENFEGG